jgi:catechol 2,3-dioxygenase-like lactoylglutathione lyase family enzyme
MTKYYNHVKKRSRMPQLNLVVLRTADIIKTLLFYRTLGLRFEQECHSSGINHYACTLGKSVIEIYPAADGSAPKPLQGGATMLGFQIENIDIVLTKLQEIGDTTPPLIQSTSSYRRVFLIDPDGRKVMLTEI